MENNHQHPFDQAIHLTGEADNYHGHTSPAYANMVGPFGGITAAVLLKALLDHPQRQGEPVTLTVNFAAPVNDGEFTIETKLMRTNRSTQHWFVSLWQNDEVAATGTAVFAIRRETWGVTDLQSPVLSDNLERIANEMLPPWTQNYEFQMANGTRAFFATNSASSETYQTIRDDPPRPVDFASLTAICDVFFPRIFFRLGQFVPIGTVSFTVYFHADSAALAAHGDAAVIGHARAHKFHNSYFDQSAEIWSLDGDLLATTTQIVYFKV
jgi:acyl-coenzyme A thioesterase PaaI-like protein